MCLEAVLGTMWLPGPRGCYGEIMYACTRMSRASVCYWERPLLSFDNITLGFGKNQLAFKLTNLFPNPSQACAGPPSQPIRSFSQGRFLLLTVRSWLLLHVRAPCRGIPSLFLLIILVLGWLFPGDFSCQLQGVSPKGRGWSSSLGEPMNAVAS